MECSIQGSGPSAWSCTISLKRQADGNGLSNASIQQFGSQITDKAEVELQIRRAQSAILSPHRSAEHFLGLSYDELKELTENDTQILKFSRDAVVVDIKDPQGTDLFFVDLPGMCDVSLSFF